MAPVIPNPRWQQNQSTNIPASYLPSLTEPQPVQQPQQRNNPAVNALGAYNAYQLGNNLFSGGADAAQVASTNIPASYLPSLNSTAIPEGFSQVGSMADGSAMLAQDAPATLLGSETLAAAAPWLGGAAAAYGAYNMGKELVSGRKMGTVGGATRGATTGAGVGTMILPGVGTAIGAGVGALGGALLGQFGHSQNYWDGQARKKVLNQVFGGNPQAVTLKDGNTYDFSTDKDRANDFKALGQDNIGMTYFRPLGLMLAGGDSKTGDGVARILYNELSKGGTATPDELRQGALRAYSYFNLKPSDVNGFLDANKGKIKDLPTDQYDSYYDIVNRLRHGGQALQFTPGSAAASTGAPMQQGGTPVATPPAPVSQPAPAPVVVPGIRGMTPEVVKPPVVPTPQVTLPGLMKRNVNYSPATGYR